MLLLKVMFVKTEQHKNPQDNEKKQVKELYEHYSGT